MKNKSTYIKLGFFVVIGMLIFVVAIFYIGSKQNLFTDTINIKAIFENVSGLKAGNSVRLNGIDVGTVTDIVILSPTRVEVTLTVVSSVQDFIKKDSRASIISEGLVGNKIVEITAGTPQAATISNNDYIETIRPIEIQDILDNLKETGDNVNVLSSEITSLVTKMNSGEGTIGQLINNDALYRNMDLTVREFAAASQKLDVLMSQASQTVNQVSGEIDKFSRSLSMITADLADITSKINSSESLVGTVLTDTLLAQNIKGMVNNLTETSSNLELASFSFYQNMEALKHNFLFKGYFEDLGYWDKADFEKVMDDREMRLVNRERQLNERAERLREQEMQIEREREKLQNDTLNLRNKR
jgi:phospholipid/cholesterol/gamma-HCH transport system substrate-binding protein